MYYTGCPFSQSFIVIKIMYIFTVVVAACQRAPSERAKRFTKFVQRSTFIIPMVQSNRDFENMSFMPNMPN